MKKNLIIMQTETHTETILTDDPDVELNRLMQTHHDIISIIMNDKVIYVKNKK
jgi:hypothetical protein|tara:strand:- start:47 stop:205 length:159 start_codon:yes stop_codon:yes gene_type:complete